MCCVYTVKAQELTLYELQKMCKLSDWQEGADFLSQKGWTLVAFDKQTVRYGYNVRENMYAEGWLEFTIDYNQIVNHIVYSSSEDNINSIKALFAANGYKKSSKYVMNDQEITTYYYNNYFCIQISIIKFKSDTGEIRNSFYVYVTTARAAGMCPVY
jgi:hypothetical protein